MIHKMVFFLFFTAAATILCEVFALGQESTEAFDPLCAPPILKPVPEKYADSQRGFQGISSLDVSQGDVVWACWYTDGPDECKDNYVLVAVSRDLGETWSKPLFAVDPDGLGPLRAFDPAIWSAPDGSLWLFFALSDGHDGRWGVWGMKTANPQEAENAEWSEPKRLCDGIMLNKPTVDSTGRWLYPVSVWRIPCMWKPERPKYDLGDLQNPDVFLSADGGASVSFLGHSHVPPDVSIFDEHHVVEMKDGSLKMFVRTTYGIGEATSADGGRTWTDVTPSAIKHTTSRFFIRRLKSGNLILVKNGPIDQDVGRSQMTAFLSEDDGKTWLGGLVLDERVGVSYPDGGQTADGTILVTHDYNRLNEREIYCHRFTEDDIRAGRIVSKIGKLGMIINKATGSIEVPPIEFTPDANDNGTAWQTGDSPEALIRRGDSIEPFADGARLFSDRDFKAKNIPKPLQGKRFLYSSIEGASVEITKGGVLYVVTPLPNRNKDNAVETLAAAGFVKVSKPEFLFFGNDAGNISTVFQKEVKPGEIIEWNKKWGVLVF